MEQPQSKKADQVDLSKDNPVCVNYNNKAEFQKQPQDIIENGEIQQDEAQNNRKRQKCKEMGMNLTKFFKFIIEDLCNIWTFMIDKSKEKSSQYGQKSMFVISILIMIICGLFYHINKQNKDLVIRFGNHNLPVTHKFQDLEPSQYSNIQIITKLKKITFRGLQGGRCLKAIQLQFQSVQSPLIQKRFFESHHWGWPLNLTEQEIDQSRQISQIKVKVNEKNEIYGLSLSDNHGNIFSQEGERVTKAYWISRAIPKGKKIIGIEGSIASYGECLNYIGFIIA